MKKMMYSRIFINLVLMNMICMICSAEAIDRKEKGVDKYLLYNKKLNNHIKQVLAQDAAAPSKTSLKLSQLPTVGKFDHNHHPGSVQWIIPKIIVQPPKAKKTDDEKDDKSEKKDEHGITIFPVYRLPIDSDDTGAQVQMEWTYTNLKVRPVKLTIEAIGPNKATWKIATVDGTKTTAIWDLRETPSYRPLIEGYYTLHIYDQRGPDTLPSPGWLQADNKMKIALYKTDMNHLRQKIEPSECATCYKFVMQGLEGFETSIANRNYTSLIMTLIISFFWILL